jgi:hypothetical protein
MSISAAHAAELLNKDFGATNYTPPATWYVGLLTAATELSGGSYARVALTNNTTNFPATATNSITNGVAFSFPQASAGWNQADTVGLFAASSGGAAKYTDSLDVPVTIGTGQTLEFAVGALTIRLT